MYREWLHISIVKIIVGLIFFNVIFVLGATTERRNKCEDFVRLLRLRTQAL